MKQTTFASAAWDKKGKVTRRERFLAEMDAVIPWARLLALIEPHYPQAGNGTQPLPMERLLLHDVALHCRDHASSSTGKSEVP
ncbi:MAG: family transposase [Chloroflexi bacterium]|nr:family transposase [Chloroflexota bacterium]